MQPPGLKGEISIDPVGDGSAFERYDGGRSPATCHLAGPYFHRVELITGSRLMLQHNIAMTELSARIQVGHKLALLSIGSGYS
jgi:hypothetical protein